jgi:hypothetical protein
MASFWDGGRSCGNFRTLKDEKSILISTPGCNGCARANRARQLREENVMVTTEHDNLLAARAATMQDELMKHLAGIAKYWADIDDKTPLERCNGVVFSILSTIDGCSGWVDAINLVQDGVTINDNAMLHEQWRHYERKPGK